MNVDELVGLWRRSRISREDGRLDTTTHVRWLQGRQAYVDLRQPPGKRVFEAVSGLGDLRPEQLAWMSGQLAFAGRLSRTQRTFCWDKLVDLHPVEPDLGRLAFQDDVLVEEALDLSYVEHWHRVDEPTSPAVEVELTADGRNAVLLRVGPTLGFARARRTELPTGTTLTEILEAQPNLRAQQDIFDCEVLHATADNGRWTVTRSSQPWREGRRLKVELSGADRLLVHIGDDVRTWTITSADGDLSAL